MRIAVIEDERKFAEVVQMGLEAEGYQVELFFDGESAQTRLEQSPSQYDLAVLDLYLPKVNGFEVCQILRQKQIMLPILILTARDTTDDKVRALDSGADDFITKPFNLDEFLARIRALLRRCQGAVQQDARLGDLVVSFAAREVKREGRLIPLTVKEFDLLHYLVANKNRVLTRDEIFQEVWGYTDEVQSNLLDVHVRNLRKKIDDPFTQKYIQTVRGVGYTIKG